MKRAATVMCSLCLLIGSTSFAQDAAPVMGPVMLDAGTSDVSGVETKTVLPSEVPENATEAVAAAAGVIQAAKAKNWWLLSAGVIWLLMFVMKAFRLFRRIGKRWAYLVVAGMSMVAMLLSKFGAGVSWETAIVVMTSGPFMAYANDLVKRGILAKEPGTELKKPK